MADSQTGGDAGAAEPASLVPVTVLTGFLGSGKVRMAHAAHPRACSHPQGANTPRCPPQTTLLNHILTAQHGKKIAVIEVRARVHTSVYTSVFAPLCSHLCAERIW